MKEAIDFIDTDKELTAKIQDELKGQVVETVCPDCKGKMCSCCDFKGFIKYQY
jgi:hypothetical protein